jgi:hypothetical protein
MAAPASTQDTPRLAVEVAELYPPQGQWTEADYFALPETNRSLELSDGELLMPPPPTYSHQTAVEELYVRLRAFVRLHFRLTPHIPRATPTLAQRHRAKVVPGVRAVQHGMAG